MSDSNCKRVLTWFEIPSTDFERAIRFYEATLGVTLRREEFCGATMAIFPYSDEVVSGAIMPPGALNPSADGLNFYLWVEDGIDAALARTAAAGGRVADPKMQLPGEMGWVAHIIDSEGNRIGLHASR